MKRGRKLEEKEGILAEIIYQNEVNSYTVGIFETEEEQFTVVGYLPFICKGDSLKIIGKFIEHKDYGEQFKIETFEKLMPQTVSAFDTTGKILIINAIISIIIILFVFFIILLSSLFSKKFIFCIFSFTFFTPFFICI